MSNTKIKIEPYNPDWFPPCFNDREQFNDYSYMIRRVGQPMDSNNYCMDCTKEYQAQMICEGKCGHPETKFIAWRTTYKDPEVEGTIVSKLNEPDIIGVSNVSRFWGVL